MIKDFLFTSESVTEGHPDKVADQISDGVLDAIIAGDPRGRVAVETLVKTGLAIVAGEVTTSTYVDIPSIVRSTIVRIGYTDQRDGLRRPHLRRDGGHRGPEPGHRPRRRQRQGAGRGRPGDDVRLRLQRDAGADAGAHLTTPTRSPGGWRTSRRKSLDWLRPDGKSQVTVQYEDGKPVRIDTVVVSTQHADDVSNKKIHEAVREEVIAQGAAQEAARPEDPDSSSTPPAASSSAARWVTRA